MHVVDAFVRDEAAADVSATVHDAQESACDQRIESSLEVRSQPGVDRVHLQQADLAFDEHLREDIHRRDARDVARAEHQRHLTSGVTPIEE